MTKLLAYFDAQPSPRIELLVLICLLFAFDMWANAIARAGRYGFGDFNVAQFHILDSIYPMPTPALYASALLLASFAAVAVTALGPNRWNVPVLAASWGYAWSSAYIDGFQHHYFLVLVFICFLGIPSRDSKQVAWGFPLLCATVANMYFWAAVAKTAPTWVDGSRLAEIVGRDRESIEAVWTAIGVSVDWAWSAVSVGTIVVELILCAAYLIAPWASKRWHRGLLWLGVALGLALHGGAEFIGLEIKWFSHYMLILTVFCLVPRRKTEIVETPASTEKRQLPEAPWIWALTASLAVIGYVAPSDMPGVMWVAVLVACGLMAAALLGLKKTRILAVAMALAAAAYAWTIDVSESRFDYWRFVGASNSRAARAQTDPTREVEFLLKAIDAYKHAELHTPAGKSREDMVLRLQRRLQAAQR